MIDLEKRVEIDQFATKRNAVLMKMKSIKEYLAMHQIAKGFTGVMTKVASVKDPEESLHEYTDKLEIWKHILPRKHFDNVHGAWEAASRSNWTQEQAAHFFQTLSLALGHDIDLLC